MKKIFFILLGFSFFALSANLDELKKAGRDGNIDALIRLGYIYETGSGVKADLQKAIRYYRQAAELGSEDAKLALALLDLHSKINKRVVSLSNSVVIKGENKLTYKLSVSDLKNVLKRAKEGDKDAFFTLATIYDNGYGDIKADKERALALYKKAAKLGSNKAKSILLLKQSQK